MMNHWDVILKSVFYSFFFVCGLMGNILVILFFSLKMKKAAQFRWFVVHLAIADCFYAVISPIHLIYLLATNNKWTIGAELCKILSISGPLSVNVSAWILCLMGYERYRAICHPFARRFSKNMIHGMVGLVWIACIGLKIFAFIRINVKNGECYPYYKNGTEQTLSSGVSLLTESIIPIFFLSYYLVRVTITMRKRSQLFETTDDNSICMRKSLCSNSSTSLIVPEKDSETNGNKLLVKNKEESKNLLQVSSSCSNNNIDRNGGKPFTEIEMTELSINVPQTSTKTNTLKWWNRIRLKHPAVKLVITPSVTKKNSSNKADRETIIVFFLAVLMFVITTLPFNANYFIGSYLYSFYFNEEQYKKYGATLEKVSDWLGLLVLSGCLSNVIIYSGRFPDFRYQTYKWFFNAKTKLLLKLGIRKLDDVILESTL